MSKSFTISGSDSYCTYVATVSSAVDSLKISGSTYNIQSLLPTALTGTITGNTWQGAYMDANIFYGSGDYTYMQIPIASWPSGTSKSSTPYQTRAYNRTTSSIFNSRNPNDREVTVYYNTDGTNGIFRGGTTAQLVGWENKSSFTLGQKLILDAPPTFKATDSEGTETTQLYFDKQFVYAGLTTASIKIANLSAKYGGTIVSATLTIGDQSVSRSDNGELSILLNAGGTFTPTVKVTDSRGQTTTKTLDPVTVNIYTVPTVTFNAERTLATGVPDDEGTYAVINPTFTFTDAITTNELQPPTITTTDEGSITETPTVTWYSTRASDGALSGSVTWSSLSSGDTVYGLLSLQSGFDVLQSYQISVTPTDSEGTGTAKTQMLAPAFFTIDVLAGGHGIAFGTPAVDEVFECAMDAVFDEELVAQDMTSQEIDDFVDSIGSGGDPVADVVVEQGTNANGSYRKWNSGTMEQWGLEASASASAHNVSFPEAFISTAYIVVCSNTSGVQANFMPSSTNVAYFTVYPTASVQLFWIAIGKWK